jgi:6-pyruvoyltetrahydropterin/6-carboxytetrahydropterin synthase
MYRSTKRYGHELGLSACFRQHRATHSHCSLLHGYALAFTFVFEAETLDAHNWVQDFGGLKDLKRKLVTMFDHTCIVAKDDPQVAFFGVLQKQGLIDLRVLGAVGCEAFANVAYHMAQGVLLSMGESQRVRVVSCECAEHGANSAVYMP